MGLGDEDRRRAEADCATQRVPPTQFETVITSIAPSKPALVLTHGLTPIGGAATLRSEFAKTIDDRYHGARHTAVSTEGATSHSLPSPRKRPWVDDF